MSEFQKRLKKTMAIRGLRQAQLAEVTGISRSLISSYVTGRYVPKDENLQILAKVLNCDALWLAGYDGIEEDKEKTLLEMFRALNATDQKTALAFIEFLKSRMEDAKS